jgi:tripartite-type tricarboxylate transporter receptor subunit TctC
MQLAAGAAALPAVSRGVFAADYPSRPVKILVGFPAGGAVDVVAAADRRLAVAPA